jgi:hypothetical protein
MSAARGWLLYQRAPSARHRKLADVWKLLHRNRLTPQLWINTLRRYTKYTKQKPKRKPLSPNRVSGFRKINCMTAPNG